jgi:putative NADH-flavin reductase
MKILLLGATGGVGNHFLHKALSEGHQVTAIVRNANKITEQHERLTVLEGDLFDSQSLTKVTEVPDVVVSCLNTSKGIQPSNELEQMISNVVIYMNNKNVNKIVYCASAGVEDEILGERGKEVMEFLRHPLQDHKNAIEAIKKGKFNYTIARPGGLTNNEKTGTYNEAFNGVPEGNMMITRADVADFMYKCLNDDKYTNQSVAIANL